MKRIRISLAAVFLLGLSSFGSAQQASPTPTAPEDAVKITTNLVQFDVVVTDKDGRQITDLKASEFVLEQDGKQQQITKFGYFARPVPDNTGGPARSGETTELSSPTKRSHTGRLITFIVDDGNCSASQMGIIASREALIKFVENQMRPNDRVAIYQTRAGSSMLQQYTSDPATLIRAAKRVQWRPPQGACPGLDGSYFDAAQRNTFNSLSVDDSGTVSSNSVQIENTQARQNREKREDLTKNNQTVGTIGVINYVVRGLENSPGRKMVFLLSDGFGLRGRDGSQQSGLAMMRELIDRANRASVVFNSINVRGVFDPGTVTAQDDTEVIGEIDTAKPTGTAAIINERERASILLEDGLFFLADQTGGRLYRNSNDLAVPIDRGLKLEQGYYLLGYEPAEETFKGKEFNKIEVKVSRPGARVISRAGFLAKPDAEVVPKFASADSELYRAISAPLPRAGLELQLTAFFGSSEAEGSFIRSFVAVGGKEITFVDEGSSKRASFDVVAVTLDERNKPVDQFNKTHTIKVDPATAELINRTGLIYSVDVPVKTEGVYNLRFAMRDTGSKSLGSAGLTISIPPLQAGKTILSGLSISEVDADGKFARPSIVKPDQGFALNVSEGNPATRRFKRPVSAAYSYSIYNAAAGEYTVQANLYKDGKIVAEGQQKPVTAPPVKGRIDDSGVLRITDAVSAGEYTLEIIVRHAVAKVQLSETIDFSVTN